MNRKNKVLLIFASAIAGFSILAFAVPFPKNAVFWIAYIAEILALILQIPVFKMAFEKNDAPSSKFLGFPICRVGYLYLGIQTVLSLILMGISFIPKFPVWIALVLCIVTLAAALILSVTAGVVRDTIQKTEEQSKFTTASILKMRNMTSAMPSMTTDSALKNALEKLADDFRFSDPVSNSQTEAIENELSDMLLALNGHISDSTATIEEVNIIQSKLAQRNLIYKEAK